MLLATTDNLTKAKLLADLKRNIMGIKADIKETEEEEEIEITVLEAFNNQVSAIEEDLGKSENLSIDRSPHFVLGTEMRESKPTRLSCNEPPSPQVELIKEPQMAVLVQENKIILKRHIIT
jgi:hypothetical protein